MQEAEPPQVLETAGRMGPRPCHAARYLLRPGPAPHTCWGPEGVSGAVTACWAVTGSEPSLRFGTPSARACAKRSVLVCRGSAIPGLGLAQQVLTPQRLPQRSTRGVGPCFPRTGRVVPTRRSSDAPLDAGAGPAPVTEPHLALGRSAGSLRPGVRFHCCTEFSEPTRRKR